jgi:alpha-ketoglutarate-dependent taurine dioxygenase
MTTSPKPPLKRPGGGRRRSISVSTGDLVKTGRLLPDSELPLLVEPAIAGVELAAWARDHRDEIARKLRKHGGILFRGFGLSGTAAFQEAVRAISGELLEYRERSSPRSAVADRVYTSTDYPADQPIFLHNENSYQQTWPMRLFFYCHVEPEQGGATPLADVRRIYQRLDPEIRDRFVAKEWAYVRNFGDGFGLPWQTVFQTDDKAAVESYCRQKGIELEWREGDRLRTRAIRPAAVRHPETGEMVWFNHATFFHVSTLTETIREELLREFEREEDLPANSYYGDGTPIEPEVLDRLRQLYHEETVSFPWRKGDLLMLDNMLVAHGRAPFEGERQVLVAMAHPRSWDELGD